MTIQDSRKYQDALQVASYLTDHADTIVTEAQVKEMSEAGLYEWIEAWGYTWDSRGWAAPKGAWFVK